MLKDDLLVLTNCIATTIDQSGAGDQLGETSVMPDVSGLPTTDNVVNQQVHDTVIGGSTLNGDTVKFTSEAPTTEAMMPKMVDPTILSASPDSALLQNFLRRPVNIHTINWTSTTVASSIDPWAKFFNTVSVQNKISNYRFARANLHLDIQLNGTPFHYGRILCSYVPMNGVDKSTGGWSQRSSCPHVMLDPSTNSVGKLVAPFIHPKQWLDLTDPTGVQCGKMFFDVLANLAVFEGGTPDPVTIQVYAWLEDVELAYPTQLIPATFVEQGKKKTTRPNGGNVNSGTDEYDESPNKGLISKPAAMVADIAGRLTNVPVIGSFATATQIGAGAISKIASIFGYSSPKDLNAPTVVLTRPTGFMATGDTADQVAPLTLNSKSELTIDPCAIGIDTAKDELAVDSIAGRWCLINSTSWTSGDAVGTRLARSYVHPAMFVDAFDLRFGVQMSNAMYASLPFQKWRGSMEVKIQVVASRYHRGRLRFQWQPEFDLSQDIQLGYNHVVDISDTKEFHLKLPYVGVEGFKDVYGFESGDPSSAVAPNYFSGNLNIVVQNVLGAPSVEPVQILIWTRCGPDMKFTSPDLDRIRRCSVTPNPAPALDNRPAPSREISDKPKSLTVHDIKHAKEQASGATTELGEAAENETVMITFFDDSLHPEYDLAYFGDPVRSFRPLLKRYTFETNFSPDTGLATLNRNDLSMAIPAWPLMPGWYNNNGSWQNNLGTVTYNVTNCHLANYLSVAHLATRGSFRVLLSPSNSDRIQGFSNPLVSRFTYPENGSTPFYGNVVQFIPNADTLGAKSATWLIFGDEGGTQHPFRERKSGKGGQVFNWDPSSGMIQVEVPYYHPYKYSTNMGAFFDQTLSSTNQAIGTTCTQGVKVSMSADIGGAQPTAANIGFDVYKAAGEDFTCSFFTGVPYMHEFAMTITEVDETAVTWAHNNALDQTPW